MDGNADLEELRENMGFSLFSQILRGKGVHSPSHKCACDQASTGAPFPSLVNQFQWGLLKDAFPVDKKGLNPKVALNLGVNRRGKLNMNATRRNIRKKWKHCPQGEKKMRVRTGSIVLGLGARLLFQARKAMQI